MRQITFYSMALHKDVTTSYGKKMNPAELKAGVDAARKDLVKHGIVKKDNTVYKNKATKILKTVPTKKVIDKAPRPPILRS